MLYIIILVAIISLATYLRWDTISPKLVVKETAHWAGITAKSAPSIAKATIETVKTANAMADLEIARSGRQVDIGYREGKAHAEEHICKGIDAYTSASKRKQKAAKLTIERIHRNAVNAAKEAQ